MPRPCKSRTLEGVPNPVLYIPSGWTRDQIDPASLAIEDFEVLRLVDGHVHTIEEAAAKVGVSRSTAGRMLERARRVLALGLERRAPIHIDASDSSVIAPPVSDPAVAPIDSGVLAVAVKDSNPDCEVARVFGRAAAFALVAADGQVSFVVNPGANVKRGAATLAVDLLRSNGVGRVVAGRFGADALEDLGTAEIEPCLMVGVKLRQAIELLTVRI
ncbi:MULTISPECIES: DUF134 domain-containing protein [unclassified Lentimonas]|uniref:DUF134 domain-containing protein n=1 Tax=unclassified Lentimonas TaxID=2630993 RepID=UPI00132B7E68|nr:MULTISPECIES: DUF134 domain-containing protein [unclassified Lentimonas]CAA6678160.1 Unannotated [Lentimonas sp. CC4]CAA6685951.1 Unannotated [Lentimonas sp. CC6]CAA7075960.1 Unannotated [Lentimonas sp. CC4]CAA7168613.1 Unannotated [Lentimonas sp. CC21]CAA7181003.1 Unannotated [Lentimonas sp. CC8]